MVSHSARGEHVADATCRSFVVEDAKYNYISARFPNDVELLSEKAANMIKTLRDG